MDSRPLAARADGPPGSDKEPKLICGKRLRSSAGDHRLMVESTGGNFLELGRLLAADAEAGFERDDVARGAEILHLEELAVVHGIQPVNLKRAVGFGNALQVHLAAIEALILHRVEKMRSVGGKRLLAAVKFEYGTIPASRYQLSLQNRKRLGLAPPQAGSKQGSKGRSNKPSCDPSPPSCKCKNHSYLVVS